LTSFLALYHGQTIGSARLIATSVDPVIVQEFAERLLSKTETQDEDPVARELDRGRRRALRLVRGEAGD
jgi:hypothetical protein